MLLGGLLGSSPARADDHPSLLFSVEDVPALNTKILSGPSAAAWGAMCTSMGVQDWPLGNGAGKCLEELAFRFSLTGDANVASLGSGALAAMAAVDPLSLYDPTDVTRFASLPVPLCVAYDLLFSALDPGEREAVMQRLEQYGDLLYDYLAQGARDALSSEVIAAYASLGLIALAIRHESAHPDLDDWATVAATELGLNGFGDAWNPGGAFDEGYAASLNGSPEALRFAEAYRRATGTDVALSTNVAQAPAWYAYGWLPHFAFAAFGQTASFGGRPYASEHLLTIGRTNDMLGKWAWHQVHGADGIDSLERPAPVSGLLAVALWYPDSVGSIADPSSAGYPLDAWFHDTHNPEDSLTGTDVGLGGVVAFRSGWTSDSVALLFKVSDEWQSRSHNDSSSFILSAYGAELAMDPAVASAGRRNAHNVAQISAPDLTSWYDDDAAMRASYRGALETVFASDWASYAAADGRYPSGTHDSGTPADLGDDTWAPVERAERMVALVRGARPYVLVADDLAADGLSAASYRWLLQLGPGYYGYGGLIGTGEPDNPLRFDYYDNYGTQELWVSVLEPAGNYGTVLAPHSVPPTVTPWQRLEVSTGPAVEAHFLMLLQPQRWWGDPEQPSVSRLGVVGGAGADLYWSDAIDRVLVRHDAQASVSDGTSTDARLLLVRQAWGTTSAWLAADATRVQTAQGGLLDSGGLRVSAAASGSRLELQSAVPPSARQIVAYGPGIAQVVLNGAPASFARSGAFVLVPAECALEERCNRMDDDCDGQVDEDDAVDAPTWYLDADGDGYGDPAKSKRACQRPDGYVAASGDCDDSDAHIHPGAAADCFPGSDDNCNGVPDSDEPACTEAAAAADSSALTCARGRAAHGAGAGLGAWLGLGLLGAWRRGRSGARGRLSRATAHRRAERGRPS